LRTSPSYIKSAARCGARILLIKVLAHPVNDLGELARNDRVFGYPAGQDVGGGVEEPPRRAVAPVEGGVFPLAEVRACASRSAVSGSTHNRSEDDGR
jgi:hypothetical protein